MQSSGGPARDNPLAEYFLDNTGRLIHKWHHYFEVYHRHFERFRGRAPVVLEFGVSHGGSLQMWRHYFGRDAFIIGVDIDPACAQLAEERIAVVIGDQDDRTFLRDLRRRFPRVDILIDDGGHTMTQQITTFEELYAHVRPDGVYLCEDLHTSYWPQFGGGVRREGTFIEYSKALIDRLHAWHSAEPGFAVDEFTRNAFALHYYDSILVIEKRPIPKPVHSRTGRPTLS
jgi:SAM-dependent methyltransferase